MAWLHVQPRMLLLYCYTIVTPFFVFSIATGRDTAANWVAALLGVLMMLDVIEQFGRLWWHKALTYVSVLLVFYLLSTAVIAIQDPSNTWAGRTPLQRALAIDIRLAVMVFTLVVLVHHLVSIPRSAFVRLLELQLLVGLLLSLFGLVQVSLQVLSNSSITFQPTNEAFQLRGNIFRMGREQIFRASSVFNEPSYFGFYLVPLIVKAAFAFRHKIYVFAKKWLHISVMIVLLLAFIANFTLTAILALGAIVLLVAILSLKSSPKASLFVISVICVVFLLILVSPIGDFLLVRAERAVGLADLSTLARVFSGYVGVLVFWENPWIGVGPGGFAFHYPSLGIFVDRELMHTPLNIWLTFLTDVGIVGFIPFACFLWAILSTGWRNRTRDPLVHIYSWSVISLLVLLTTVDLWYIDLVWLELAMLLALSTGPSLFRQTTETKDSWDKLVPTGN